VYVAFDDEGDGRVAEVDDTVGFGLVVTLVLAVQPATSIHVVATITISDIMKYFFIFTISKKTY
jgi:hypothetical protein